MNAQSMLEQLLKAGMSMLDSKAPGASGASNATGAAQGWGKFGAGAATGGAIGLLLGSKRGRRFGGKALKYGSVAALGLVAFKAYSNWQAQQAHQAGQRQPSGQAMPPAATPAASPPRTVNLLPAPEVQDHSRAMLQAMIAAAKADGHLDERERGLVEAELSRIEADGAARQWFEAELRRPLDPADVARSASTPELAAEMYLASLLVADETSFMERAYLDELARQLRLPDGLKVELERQALAA
jgi:uncharacterized membrane protein YebE (DUF533 family)